MIDPDNVGKNVFLKLSISLYMYSSKIVDFLCAVLMLYTYVCVCVCAR